MAADLDSLITTEIPDGRQNLLDSYTNLERVAEYCENNYFQSDNKRAALEETKGYTTQSLASVAYQINTLAYNFLQMLDLQSSQIQEMESQINHISQTVSIHKEKVARREIGVLTTNKCSNRQYKIIAPANPERPIKYVRKPIDYGILDHLGHGVKSLQKETPRQLTKRPSAASQYAPGNHGSPYAPGMGMTYGSIGNVSQNSAGPAPTTKPPTPPQNRFPSGTLNRSKDYRTPPVVAPPQVPSNYAPNYPKGSSRGQQYGTLPHNHPQVGMVHPQPQEGGATMPRLSSSSMRSTGSGGAAGLMAGLNTSLPHNLPDHHQQTYGVTRKPSSSSDMDPHDINAVLKRQTSQASTGSRNSGQYGVMMGGSRLSRGDRGSTPPSSASSSSQYGMTRPTQRPPSPPGQGYLPGQQMQYGRVDSQVYARQDSASHSPAGQYGRPDNNSVYSTRHQLAPSQDQTYSTRQQLVAAAPQDQTYSTRQQLAAVQQDQTYSTRQQLAAVQQDQTYSSRQQLAALQQDQTYSSRSQLQAQQPSGGGTYSRQNSNSSVGGGVPGGVPVMPGIMPSNNSGIVTKEALPGWVPKNFLEKVVAIYDYNADKEDELTFQEGQVIYVLKKNDDGWWEGVMEGITGLFPGNYVEQTV